MSKRWTIMISFTLSFLFISIISTGQLIYIGQPADHVKSLIERMTKDHGRVDSYGHSATSIWSWDVKYFNGSITEVIQCRQNEYLLDMRMHANFCRIYKMKNNILETILTQFQNISKEKIENDFDHKNTKHKIGRYYFDDDYEHYSEIYLGDNGLATIEWRQTDMRPLPPDIRNSVNANLKAFENERKQDELPQHIEEPVQPKRQFGLSILRGCKGRRILSTPTFESFEGNGMIAIDINIDTSGNVISAFLDKGDSNIDDDVLINRMKDKAFQIKFSRGKEEEIGTLLFKFANSNP